MPQPPLPSSSPPLARLPGRVSWWNEFVGFSSSLWLGDEWLLLADSHMMRDEYRRFYYRDIQALQMRRTSRGLVYNLVLGGLTALSGLIVALASSTPTASQGGRLFWGLATVVFVTAFVVNILRGPTCHCQLQTAASRVSLSSLSRVRHARRAFDRIRERIAAAQGGLIAPEEAVERMNQHLAQAAQRTMQARMSAANAVAAAVPPAVPPTPTPPAVPGGGPVPAAPPLSSPAPTA